MPRTLKLNLTARLRSRTTIDVDTSLFPEHTGNAVRDIIGWVTNLSEEDLRACNLAAERVAPGAAAAKSAGLALIFLDSELHTQAKSWLGRHATDDRLHPDKQRPARETLAGVTLHYGNVTNRPEPLTRVIDNALIHTACHDVPSATQWITDLDTAYGHVRDFHAAFARCTPDQAAAVLRLVPDAAGDGLAALVDAVIATDLT